MPALCFRRMFEAEAGRIHKLARRAGRGFAAEDVHDLRVEIKRLRALLGVIESGSREFGRRDLFKPFRRLFKAAAGLREARVGRHLAGEWAADSGNRLDEYRNALMEDDLRSRKTFAGGTRKFERSFSLRASEAIDRALPSKSARDLERLTEGRWDALRGRLLELKAPRPAKRDLHRIRVQAKMSRYTLEILQECFRPGDAGLARLSRALRSVHQALGRWHDLELAAASLRDFLGRRAERPLSDPRAYEAYGRFLASERVKRLEEFETAWREFERMSGRP
jgi:CHAD domain-containing protein